MLSRSANHFFLLPFPSALNALKPFDFGGGDKTVCGPSFQSVSQSVNQDGRSVCETSALVACSGVLLFQYYPSCLSSLCLCPYLPTGCCCFHWGPYSRLSTLGPLALSRLWCCCCCRCSSSSSSSSMTTTTTAAL